MKKIILLVTTCLWLSILQAQDKIYVHVATAANTYAHITYIDHPDLNNNPNAGVVFNHVWNANGLVDGIYNNNIDGLWYDSSAQRWTIYNEDLSAIVEGAQYFVYIAQDPNDVITHVASVANQNSGQPYYTILDPTIFGSNPGPFATFSHYYNENSVYNDGLEGFFYDTFFGSNSRNIYEEAGFDIPEDAAYRILVSGSGTVAKFTHEATAANTLYNYTLIDHPNLNGNPNATFVFAHYWGINGAGSEVNLAGQIGAWYSTTANQWGIYYEDNSSTMEEGTSFDIIVAQQDILGVDDNNIKPVLSLYPNPAKEYVNISTNVLLKQIEIYNLLGQMVKQVSITDSLNSIKIPISELQTGTYMAKITTQNGQTQTLKLLKN